MSDHDLLVTLNAKFDVFLAWQKAQETINTDFGKRLDSLEATRDQQLGAYRMGGVSARAVVALCTFASALTTVAAFLLTQLVRGGLHP